MVWSLAVNPGIAAKSGRLEREYQPQDRHHQQDQDGDIRTCCLETPGAAAIFKSENAQVQIDKDQQSYQPAQPHERRLIAVRQFLTTSNVFFRSLDFHRVHRRKLLAILKIYAKIVCVSDKV